MPQIEFLIVADHAEAVNGKLYVTGAGWTDMWRGADTQGTPTSNHFGIAIGLLVPWTQTNRRHQIQMRIENEDGTAQLATVEGEFEVGRPAGIPPGVDQRAVIAVNADIQFKEVGGYRVVATVNDGSGEGSMRSVSFRVHDRPPSYSRAGR